MLRRAKARHRLHDAARREAAIEAPTAVNAGEATIDGESLRAAVRQAAATFRFPTREILLLRFAQGLTYAEVADVLNVPVAHVHVAVSRSMQRLVTRLRRLV
jgi:RNA polymerase sigma factor (sigma-70 family)